MQVRSIAYSLLAAISMTAFAAAQQYAPNNGGYPPTQGGNVQPDQPVRPQDPTLERRAGQPGVQQPGMQQPPALPKGFPLTPQEEVERDQVLALWERANLKVKTFDCRFKRWVYNATFGKPDVPMFIDLGVLRYAAPDKGIFRVETTEHQGREEAIEPARAEHWVADGKAIIEFNHVKKQKIVHKLPPELQGQAIKDTPLPFLFGSNAQQLRERYLIRVITPPKFQGQEIWIEAFPRRQEDAANFHHAQFIITAQKMEPYALRLYQPNPKNYIVYSFYQNVVNEPFRLFGSDPYRPPTPFGWKSFVEEPQGGQARRPPNDGQR